MLLFIQIDCIRKLNRIEISSTCAKKSERFRRKKHVSSEFRKNESTAFSVQPGLVSFTKLITPRCYYESCWHLSRD